MGQPRRDSGDSDFEGNCGFSESARSDCRSLFWAAHWLSRRQGIVTLSALPLAVPLLLCCGDCTGSCNYCSIFLI